MATSHLTASDIAGLTNDKADLQATKLAMAGGGTSLVLARWNPNTERWVARPAQTVLVKYAEGVPQVIADESGGSVVINGWFSRELPFDVERDDRFALGTTGNEENGDIIRVYDPKLGIQRAAFRLFLGEPT